MYDIQIISKQGLRVQIVANTRSGMEPNQHLTAWMAKAEITNAELARRLSYDPGNLHRILNGKLRPSIDLAYRIDSLTGGAVPMSAWARDPS